MKGRRPACELTAAEAHSAANLIDSCLNGYEGSPSTEKRYRRAEEKLRAFALALDVQHVQRKSRRARKSPVPAGSDSK